MFFLVCFLSFFFRRKKERTTKFNEIKFLTLRKMGEFPATSVVVSVPDDGSALSRRWCVCESRTSSSLQGRALYSLCPFSYRYLFTLCYFTLFSCIHFLRWAKKQISLGYNTDWIFCLLLLLSFSTTFSFPWPSESLDELSQTCARHSKVYRGLKRAVIFVFS